MTDDVPRPVVIVHGVDSLSQWRVREAIAHVTAGELMQPDVTVTFLGPRRMRALNARHLGHDRVTDVIAFALPQPDGTVIGDIYICRYLAARHAREAGESLPAELLRLVVHGTLHVLGYDHPDGTARTGSAMWRRQESHVRALTCTS